MYRLAAAVFLTAALMTACGNGGSDNAQSPTTDDVTATSSATTTPPDRTTTPTAPGVCPAASVPAGATDVSTAAGDFDGDGRPDEVRTYRHTGDYHVQIGLAAGGGDTLRVVPEFQAGLAPIGGFDIDGDDGDEVWVNVSSGGPVRVVGLFAFDDCSLAEVALDGAPARFTINRTFLGGAGVECAAEASDGTGLTVFEGSSGDGANFMVRRGMLTLGGAAFTEVAEDTFNTATITTEFTFNCGSLSL